MKLRERRMRRKPELMIIPMIDIMFFLLVFFMLGTMYMMNLRTVPVQLPVSRHSTAETKPPFMVAVKADGSLWQNDHSVDLAAAAALAAGELYANPELSVVIRADREADYGTVMHVMDAFRSAGVKKFGLAAEAEK